MAVVDQEEPMRTESTTIRTKIPPRLFSQMRLLVEDGWFGSVDEIVVDAVRRFVETHHGELAERFLREDVEWGLHGGD